ncbi:uncharacterized protein LOC106073727 [Biomphalaria glabrata]|uniref:Uncharacterized protein LOC106073727 n=1 Tax=Biomphalaria glabrata TaxID=6526 RepID=A0A9W2ZBL6_BIOGL|nr:uncharacterized protein LOC106073727 [Biomphalaria glabrata]XP_055872349.1 uncharacterized protein LOC106073727 [Biomphalaria glabrata]
MWLALVDFLCTISVFFFQIVHCQNGFCKNVEMFQSVTLDCEQEATSTDRFILWRYLNGSGSAETGAVNCFFNETCSVIDSSLFAVTDLSSSTRAKTQLTMKNATADQSGWAITCYVLDFLKDLSVSLNYNLLVYKSPTVECTSRITNASTVKFSCIVLDVYPKRILCLFSCDHSEHQNISMQVTDYSTYSQSNFSCQHSLPLKSYDCKVSVLAIEALNDCNYSFELYNVSSYVAETVPNLNVDISKHTQHLETADFGLDKSYLISIAVAIVVIPVSICTLYMVIRQRRRNIMHYNSRSITPIPEYIQQNTSHELVSAGNTTYSSDDCEEWCMDDVSNIYTNIVSEHDLNENDRMDEPSTLPFQVDNADGNAEINAFSMDMSLSAPPPVPHTSLKNVQAASHTKSLGQWCSRSRELIEENTQLLKINCDHAIAKPSSRYQKINSVVETSHREFPKPLIKDFDGPYSHENSRSISSLSDCSCQSVTSKKSRDQGKNSCNCLGVSNRSVDKHCRRKHTIQERDASKRQQEIVFNKRFGHNKQKKRPCQHNDHRSSGQYSAVDVSETCCSPHRVQITPVKDHCCQCSEFQRQERQRESTHFIGRHCHRNVTNNDNDHPCRHRKYPDENFHGGISKDGAKRFHEHISSADLTKLRSDDEYTDNDHYPLDDFDIYPVYIQKPPLKRDTGQVGSNITFKDNTQCRSDDHERITISGYDAGQCSKTVKHSESGHSGHCCEEQAQLYIDPCLSQSSSARSSSSESNAYTAYTSREEVSISERTDLLHCSPDVS